MADDQGKRVTLSGRPPAPGYHGPAPRPLDDATGMHADYWVLSPEERAKGWVRPFRNKYLHTVCGVVTKMGQALSETYARDPKFYSGTFCVGCKQHFPVAEFLWDGTNERVGT